MPQCPCSFSTPDAPKAPLPAARTRSASPELRLSCLLTTQMWMWAQQLLTTTHDKQEVSQNLLADICALVVGGEGEGAEGAEKEDSKGTTDTTAIRVSSRTAYKR